jgi:hypothetical protein
MKLTLNRSYDSKGMSWQCVKWCILTIQMRAVPGARYTLKGVERSLASNGRYGHGVTIMRDEATYEERIAP